MTRKQELIKKLFRSQCSEQELHELMCSLRHSEEDVEIEVMERLWEEIGENPEDRNAEIPEGIYERIVSNIHMKDRDDTPVISLQRLRRRRLVQYSSAAILIALAGATLWLWTSKNNSAAELITTTYDEEQVIELPDQSIVKLAPYSELIYAKKWNRDSERQVKLKGEAFFQVKKYPTSNVKFQVLTSDLTAEVLGTSFIVKAGVNQTEVILEEGQVRLDLKERNKDIIMEVGDVITYSLQTKERSKRHLTKDNSTFWQGDIVTMKNVKLSEILQVIEEIYDVKIMAKSKNTLDRVFTIGVPNNNFETTLSVLKEVVKLNVIEEGDHYAIM